MNENQLGIMAYQAYGSFVGWHNYQGLPMPPWEKLPEIIQNAWIASALTIWNAK